MGTKATLKPMKASRSAIGDPLVQHAAGNLREPVIDAASSGTPRADQHVMEMRDDEIGVVHLPVERHEATMTPVSPPMTR